MTNTYAAALWALDYFCYMAYNTNMGGMNLHNGPIGSNSGSYNAISPIGVSSTPLSLQPPGYGLWVFHYGSQGQPLKTTLTNSSGANVTAYGLLETNGGETVHVINRTYGSSAVDASVMVTPGGSYTHAQVIYMQQANSDVTATSGITFGGAAMDSNGNWTGGATGQRKASREEPSPSRCRTPRPPSCTSTKPSDEGFRQREWPGILPGHFVVSSSWCGGGDLNPYGFTR